MPAEPRNRHTRTASSAQNRSLPRPKCAKIPLRRVRSATRRYPEAPRSLPEPKGAPSASPGPTNKRSPSMSVAQTTDQTSCGRARMQRDMSDTCALCSGCDEDRGDVPRSNTSVRIERRQRVIPPPCRPELRRQREEGFSRCLADDGLDIRRVEARHDLVERGRIQRVRLGRAERCKEERTSPVKSETTFERGEHITARDYLSKVGTSGSACGQRGRMRRGTAAYARTGERERSADAFREMMRGRTSSPWTDPRALRSV